MLLFLSCVLCVDLVEKKGLTRLQMVLQQNLATTPNKPFLQPFFTKVLSKQFGNSWLFLRFAVIALFKFLS